MRKPRWHSPIANPIGDAYVSRLAAALKEERRSIAAFLEVQHSAIVEDLSRQLCDVTWSSTFVDPGPEAYSNDARLPLNSCRHGAVDACRSDLGVCTEVEACAKSCHISPRPAIDGFINSSKAFVAEGLRSAGHEGLRSAGHESEHSQLRISASFGAPESQLTSYSKKSQMPRTCTSDPMEPDLMFGGSHATSSIPISLDSFPLAPHEKQCTQFQMKSPWSDSCCHDVSRVKLLSIIRQDSSSVQWQVVSTEKGFQGSWWIVHPASPVRGLWLVACVIVLLTDLVMTPVNVCFNRKATTFSRSLNTAAVLFWTADILMTFCTAVQTATHLEVRPAKIANLYIRSSLAFDVVLVAFEWVLDILGYFAEDDGINDEFWKAPVVRLLRWGRLMRLLRMAKMRQFARSKHFIRRIVSKLYLSKVYAYVTPAWSGSACLLVMLVHVLSCFWYAVGKHSEEGWVYVNGLETASVSYAYIVSLHWSFSRLHGIKSSYEVNSGIDIFVETLLVLLSLMIAFCFLGLVVTVSLKRTNSVAVNLWEVGMRFVQAHKISAELELKLMKVLHSSGLCVNSEIAAEEMTLLEALPRNLRHDLLFEARARFLLIKPLFCDMYAANQGVMRHLCSEAASPRAFYEGEAVFESGEACHQMLFVSSGSLFYVVKGRGTIPASSSSCDVAQREDQHGTRLERNSSISEPVLWTQWNHRGNLLALDESTVVVLSATEFANVILQHRVSLVHAARYAKRFVLYLNHTEYSDDLVEFDELTVEALDQFLFKEEDHLVFISHYKLEAGTEASLVRDLLAETFRQDPGHPANELPSAIFVDSEDLTDLAALKEHVKHTSALVVLLTPGLLYRPWCLVEIVTAVEHDVTIVPVEIQRPGFSYKYPDEEFYDRLRTGKLLNQSAADLLQGESIGPDKLENAIRRMFQKIALPFSPHKTKAIREAELHDICKRCGFDESSFRMTPTNATSKTFPSIPSLAVSFKDRMCA